MLSEKVTLRFAPKLRFDKSSSNWSVKKLRDFKSANGKVIKAGPFGSALKKEDYVETGYKIYGQEQVIKNDAFYGDYYISDEKYQKLSSCKVKPGDLLISLVGTLGKVLIVPDNAPEGIINPRLLRISIPTEQIHPHFLKYYLETEKAINMLNASSQGGTMGVLNAETVGSILIAFPQLGEQKKIASFLMAVDEKIQQLDNKKLLLIDYKKGVMEQLFSQKIRFNDENGQVYLDWEEKQLREIAKRVTQKNRANDVSFVLTNSAIQGIVSQQDYFDKDIANQNNLEGYYVVELDDFIYNPRISASAPVGPIKRNKLVKGVMSPLYTVFRFNDTNLKFIEFFFETVIWHEYLKSVANYGARHDRMSISNEDFLQLPIPQPSSQEQAKIVEFLTSLESKVNLLDKQLYQAQQFKKGLLQQLFV